MKVLDTIQLEAKMNLTSVEEFCQKHKKLIIDKIEESLKAGILTVYFYDKLDSEILNCVLEEYRTLGFYAVKDIKETTNLTTTKLIFSVRH
jgi:hypothetical protein